MNIERRHYLGGSDAAAVMGLSRWKSPIALWAEKTGRVEPGNISDKLPVKLGIRLEQIVCELFTEETGLNVRRVNDVITHKEHSFLCANIDRRIVGENAILEAKTCSAYKASEWNDDVPVEYLLQCYHYLAVARAKTCYLAVLIGNHEFKIKKINRDEHKNQISHLIDAEVKFWNNHILADAMPEVVTSRDSDVLFALFPNANQPALKFGDESIHVKRAIEQRISDKKLIDDATTRMKESENVIKYHMQDHETAQLDDYRITWKNQTRKSIDVKRLAEEQPDIAEKYQTITKMRVLRITEKKKENDND